MGEPSGGVGGFEAVEVAGDDDVAEGFVGLVGRGDEFAVAL